MRYRIGFWIGPTPVDDASACADLHTHLHTSGQFVDSPSPLRPPCPRIARFADAVLAEFPADREDSCSPWKYSDTVEDAHGETFTPVLNGPDRRVIGRLTQLAHDHGLQVFDLAAHRVLRTQDVEEWEDGPWLTGRVGGDVHDPDVFACDGPEIARERLGMAPTPDAPEDPDEDDL